MFVYTVILHHPIIENLDYSSQIKLEIGTVVRVTVKSKVFTAIIIKNSEKTLFDLKPIFEVTNILISERFLNFVSIMTKYTLQPKTGFLKTSLSVIEKELLKKNPRKKTFVKNEFESTLKLNKEQEDIRDRILFNDYNAHLVFGITGSGKTELALGLIEKCIEQKKQTLILVPEIGIINQWQRRIELYFPGLQIGIWHSNAPAKNTFIKLLIDGEIEILIGARSGLLVPLNNLGLIIVDEEHDSSYKQENFPIYNARHMALLRAKTELVPIVLLSATPSVESYWLYKNNKITIHRLKNRYGSFSLPQIRVVHRGFQEVITQELEMEIKENLIKKEQSLIYLNKRGYSYYLTCESCRIVLKCSNCSACLVIHKVINGLKCHYCNQVYKFSCNSCLSSDFLKHHGVAVEQIKDIIQQKFPKSNIIVFSSDYCNSNKKLTDLITKIEKEEVDIIIGTQMISKGYDLKKLTLVGIIDVEFLSSDFRGRERLYQSAVQVSGRAGRHLPGARVIVQGLTFEKSFCYDYEAFLEKEMGERSKWGLPPFKKLILCELKSKNEKTIMFSIKELQEKLTNMGIKCSMPFSGKKISTIYCWKIFILKKNCLFDEEEAALLNLKKQYKNLIIDVDPVSII